MSGKTIFFFNLLWKSNANDLSLLLITLFLSNQDIMLFIVFTLDIDSFMILSVISILVSSAKKCQFEGCFIPDISINIITIYQE